MDLQAQLILKDGSLIEFKSRLSEEGEACYYESSVFRVDT